MSFTLQVSRKRQCVLVALDKSGSMGGSRMEAAKEGASMVLNELHDGDLIDIKCFNDKIEDLSDGVQQVSAALKQALGRKLYGVQANGMTSLYDVTLHSGVQILDISAKTKALGDLMSLAGADMSSVIPNFWVVVLTDGEDTSSETSLADACEVLKKLDTELGSLKLVKIMLIGVQLDPGAAQKMQQIAKAGGSSTVFENLSDVSKIISKFQDISLQIRLSAEGGSAGGGGSAIRSFASRVCEVDDDDEVDDSSWPGGIKKGSHVRVLKSTRGFGTVSVGDVGIVKGMDKDGDFEVDFESHSRWFAHPSDIVVDAVADLVREGQRVKVKSSVSTPKFTWGPINHNMVGLVVNVAEGKVKVEFGFQSFMTFLLAELEPVFDCSAHHGLGDMVRPGVKVRVKASVREPRFGWGNVDHNAVGQVRGVQHDGIAVVRFPGNARWKGEIRELEALTRITMMRGAPVFTSVADADTIAPPPRAPVRPALAPPPARVTVIMPTAVAVAAPAPQPVIPAPKTAPLVAAAAPADPVVGIPTAYSSHTDHTSKAEQELRAIKLEIETMKLQKEKLDIRMAIERQEKEQAERREKELAIASREKELSLATEKLELEAELQRLKLKQNPGCCVVS